MCEALKDDAGVGAKRPRDIGHAGRGQRADEQHIHAQRHDAGGEGVLQHVAGEARVLADDDFAPVRGMMRVSCGGAENVGGRAAELEGGFRGDGFDVRDAAYAVGSEKASLGCHTLGFESLEGGVPCSNRCGFFSTFLLMRYHRAHARIRQVTFGLQSFITISLTMFIVKK